MKKRIQSILSLILTVVMFTGILAGCGKGGAGTTTGPEGIVIDPDAVEVSVLIPSDFETHMTEALNVFQKSHPDIRLNLIIGSEESGKVATELSTMAAGNKLPDVAVGVENFAYILSQGLAYPLDNLYAADPDKDDALQAGINNFTYNGHLYALPFRVQFNGIIINKDLLETKNLDEPDYDWTVDEFIDLAKKATDNQYSGINIVDSGDNTHDLQTKLMGAMMSAPYQMYGYNMDTHEFDFTSGPWTKAQDYIKELRSVPGLISDELKEWGKRNQGIADAYDNKFGGSADAMVAGRDPETVYERLMIGASRAFPQYSGMMVPEAAKLHGKSRADTILDVLLGDDFASTEISFGMCEEDVEEVMAYPRTMIGTDGLWYPDTFGAHPRAFASFPRVLGHYVRERKVVSFEEAIRKMTSMPAALYGLEHKGMIRVGYDADLCLLDPETIIDAADYKNWNARCPGLKQVFVAGQPVVTDSVHDGRLLGKALLRSW